MPGNCSQMIPTATKRNRGNVSDLSDGTWFPLTSQGAEDQHTLVGGMILKLARPISPRAYYVRFPRLHPEV